MKILIAFGIRGGDIERLQAVAPDVEFVVAKTKEEAIEKIADADAAYASMAR